MKRREAGFLSSGENISTQVPSQVFGSGAELAMNAAQYSSFVFAGRGPLRKRNTHPTATAATTTTPNTAHARRALRVHRRRAAGFHLHPAELAVLCVLHFRLFLPT